MVGVVEVVGVVGGVGEGERVRGFERYVGSGRGERGSAEEGETTRRRKRRRETGERGGGLGEGGRETAVDVGGGRRVDRRPGGKTNVGER